MSHTCSLRDAGGTGCAERSRPLGEAGAATAPDQRDAFQQRTAQGQSAPRLASLRVPSDASAMAIVGHAHVWWRLSTRGKDAPLPPESGNPEEEYRHVCEFMRLYATMRFYQLALLLGTTGSIITALSSHAVRASFAQGDFLRVGGVMISLGFLVMEFRATSYWHRLRDRGNQLAAMLRFMPFPATRRWNPLTTSGVGFYLHVFITSLWLCSLFVRLQPDL